MHIPGGATNAHNAQRRALNTDHRLGVNDKVKETEDGTDDVVIGLADLVATLNGASVAVAAAGRTRGSGTLRFYDREDDNGLADIKTVRKWEDAAPLARTYDKLHDSLTHQTRAKACTCGEEEEGRDHAQGVARWSRAPGRRQQQRRGWRQRRRTS